MSPSEVIAGKYRIEKTLGRGSFGDTYLVRDLATDLQRAIKLAGTDTPEFAERFHSEAKLVSRIDNPHIARVFDFGLFEGRPYLVMEYIAGPTVQAMLSQAGRLPVAAAVTTLRAVATGLAAVHDCGIIHRDLKPANVILRGNSHDGATLIDFGVAGSLENDGLTRAGQVFGTIFHMAPEQILGHPQSTATDVFGAGVLLFWMLFGRQPFEGESVTAVVSNILNQPLAIPPDPEIPDALRLLLTRCLAKDPVMRPQSARDLLVEIEPIHRALRPTPLVADIPIAAGAVTFRLVKITIVAAVVMVLVLLGWISWRERASSGQPWRVLAAVAGILIALAGIPLGFAIRKWVNKRRSRIEGEATRLLFGAKSRQSLTETLAIEVDRLIQQLDRLDERILGISIAIMVQEFKAATQADARQKALIQMVELLEKVRYRLTPWYVRHEKLIAIVVSVLTCVSGAATAAANILKKGGHP
jgi:hypothetical protein